MILLASYILTASLACGQAGTPSIVRLPPVDEEPALFASEMRQAEASSRDAAWEPFTDTEESLPGTSTQWGWIAASGQNGFGTFDFDVNHTWLFGYDDWSPLNITPGLGVHFWQGPADIDLPAQVYDLYLDLQWQPLIADRWGLALGLTPGFYGDGERWDGDAFQLTGWLLANYHLHENVNVLAGVAYVRQLRSHLLPVGGIVWTPNEDSRYEILFPNPSFKRRLWQTSEGSTWCSLAGQFGGGAWAVADTPEDNVLVTYSDLRLLLGVQHYRVSGWEWSLDVGYVFGRDLAVDDYVVGSPSDSFLVQGSVAF